MSPLRARAMSTALVLSADGRRQGGRWKRRHLTEGQRAGVAYRSLSMYEQEAKARQGERTDLDAKDDHLWAARPTSDEVSDDKTAAQGAGEPKPEVRRKPKRSADKAAKAANVSRPVRGTVQTPHPASAGPRREGRRRRPEARLLVPRHRNLTGRRVAPAEARRGEVPHLLGQQRLPTGAA